MEALAAFHLSSHPLPRLPCNRRLPLISNTFSVFQPTSCTCPSIRVSCSSAPFCSNSFRQNPKPHSLHSSNPLSYTLLILTSIATASLLFLRFHSKTLIHFTISPSISHSDHDWSTLAMERKVNHVQAIWHYKLQVNVERKVPRMESKLDHSWNLLKTQIYFHLSELEYARIGFEKLLENDPFQRKPYREKLVENLEMIDELKDLLGSVQMAMNKLDEDKNQFYPEIKSMVKRIRALEDKAIGTLTYYQELEKKKEN